ncbi:MAG: GNAT family N-acetyltransferase [Oceanospirillaceae bacterium]|nr:GNAT family N-acetyltransferase [Oceanospirillaceae bacterium]
MSDAAPTPRIRQAQVADLEPLTGLFVEYRRFYGYPHEPERARLFLEQRFEDPNTHLFLAEYAGKVCGFAQCYAGPDSLSCRSRWLLSDLFIHPEQRGLQLGRALLERVRQEAVTAGCSLVELFTAQDNRVARRLYESAGYEEDKTFVHYELVL